MSVQFYQSMSEFLASLPEKASGKAHGGRRSQGQSWDGGQSYEQARANLRTGRPESFIESEKLLEKLEDAAIEVDMPSLDTGRTGFLPCVPAYLAGSPDSMFSIQDMPVDSTPIKIMAGITYSAGLTAEKARNRGIAMLALARKLSMIRSTELWVFADIDGKDTGDGSGKCAIPVVRIDTSPLDTATASYALTDVAFLRQLCFEWGSSRGFNGFWAWRGTPTSDTYQERLRKVLNAGPDDVVLPGGFLHDQLLNRPLDWVNDQIKKFLAKREENTCA